MGRRTHHHHKVDSMRSSKTLPPSPTHSSSSSDFEFTISISPRKSSTLLCPADELFYKGQLLPLHLSPRISMVRTLLLASSSTSSSSDTTTTASRDSTGSSSSFTSDVVLLDCDSSRPSSVTDLDDELKKLNINNGNRHSQMKKISTSKYFNLLKLSSVFKHNKTRDPDTTTTTTTTTTNLSGSSQSSVKKISVNAAKEVIRKYFKKVKPLYEKISTKQKYDVVLPQSTTMTTSRSVEFSTKPLSSSSNNVTISHSFSGNLRYPRRRSYISSCPSSMRSSPSHSGVLSSSRNNKVNNNNNNNNNNAYDTTSSSMEELQSAIQGAIAHCKNSMLQTTTKSLVTNYQV
ncbi:hypothetical protein ACFE04_007586 [Oxalis oulophora]